MRHRFIVHPKTGALIPRDEYVRPETAGYYIISDTMDAAAHPCTGKMIDSKSRFRRITREHGCIEVGNSAFPKRQPYKAPGLRDTLRRAFAQHS